MDSKKLKTFASAASAAAASSFDHVPTKPSILFHSALQQWYIALTYYSGKAVKGKRMTIYGTPIVGKQWKTFDDAEQSLNAVWSMHRKPQNSTRITRRPKEMIPISRKLNCAEQNQLVRLRKKDRNHGR